MVSYLGFKANGMGVDTHLTVLYLGDITHDQPKIDRVNEYIATYRDDIKGSHYVTRNDIQLFGPDNDIPVLRVIPMRELWDIRHVAERTLWNASQFKEWNPHITLPLDTEATLMLPRHIRVNEFGLY